MAAWHRSVVATWQHRVHHPHSWRRCCNRPTPLGSPVAPKLGHLRPKCLWRRQAWLASRRLYLPNVCASDPPLQPTSSLKLGGSTKPTSQERVRGAGELTKAFCLGRQTLRGSGGKPSGTPASTLTSQKDACATKRGKEESLWGRPMITHFSNTQDGTIPGSVWNGYNEGSAAQARGPNR